MHSVSQVIQARAWRPPVAYHHGLKIRFCCTWRREQECYIRTVLARPNSHHRIMLTDHDLLLFGSLLLCLLLLSCIRRVKQDWQAFGNLPAYSVLVSPIDILSRVLPRIPHVSDGRDWSWRNVYERQSIPRV